VGLGGTDVCRFLVSDPGTVIQSLELADALVGLHKRVGDALPDRFRDKVTVIYQSAQAARHRYPSRRRSFDVLVIGHLREEKDPLRAAEAARQLPADSHVRVVHLGRAHDASWAERALAEMKTNPGYVWRSEVAFWQVRRALARTLVMVLSSIMEGGANVISEVVVAGVPVLASKIAGSIGLPGPDYPGYFPVSDTDTLAKLMLTVEQDSEFLNELPRRCAARAPLFHPARERTAWQELLARLGGDSDRGKLIGAQQELTR
jgi:putative glycosyltransferase (TIGR04348 family)